ncbi:zinc finger MYM-type protein 1-like [Aphis craccivora]|uniref:Zinc finger MYM-type protein 1-like n=1 Tax=Aphis craccivora TaxID=307492 RepID=A0A6G0W233_APHCR|nr:zinc finger MYM-type protein 1-like [Aphis craccivora]
MSDVGSLQDLLKLCHISGLKEVFPTLYKALHIATTLSVTSASPERTFSKLKIIKNRLRSTILQGRHEKLILYIFVFLTSLYSISSNLFFKKKKKKNNFAKGGNLERVGGSSKLFELPVSIAFGATGYIIHRSSRSLLLVTTGPFPCTCTFINTHILKLVTAAIAQRLLDPNKRKYDI